jgi:hypothetical protein
MTISNFSTTASNNTSINGVSIAEGMSPSDVNNALREYSKDLRTVWNDKEWFLLGSGNQTVTYTRASATSVTINADVSSTYHVGRRVKVVGTATGVKYGKIATSSYSSPNTTVTFTFDSGSINSGDTTVSVFVGSVFNNPSVPVIDTDAMTEDSAILPPSQQSVKAFVESGSITMTNKTLTSPTLTSPVLNTSLSGTAFKDEDNMSSNSATAVASQQSIKAYVDTQITAQDLDITTDSGNIDIDLDGESLTLTGGTGIDTSATGNTVTHAIDSTVATLTGTQTLTNKTVTGSKLKGTTQIEIGDTLDFNDGNIDFQGGTLKLDGSSPKGGFYNTALGELSLRAMGTSSTGTNNYNTAVGYATLRNLTGGGQNTAIGNVALNSLTGNAGNNTAVGYEAGKFISSGQNNTILGSFDGNENSLDIRTSSGNIVIADGNGEIRFYANSSGNVGIGTVSPSTKLHVNGDITADNGKITVSDGSSSTAINLGGTLTFDSNSFGESSGTVSVKTAGIGNTQVATGVDATKIADGSVTNAEFQYIGGLTSDAQTQLTGKLTASNNLSDVSSASTSRTNLGLGTISTQASNNVSITGGAISGLSLPTADTEASSKLYVDNAIAGMRTRIITRVATTGNVNLTNGLENGDSIDGITLQTGDKILVKSNTDATENGIYICPNSGTASRDTNYDTVEELAGQMIVVQQGSTNADKIFLCTTDNSGSIGSVDIVFSQVTPANQGTVQSVAVADAGSSEFTVTGSPITSSGTINLAVNSINATKIGSGNVDNTELGYLNGVTSNIQTQLDNSASLGDAISFAVALGS